MSQGISCKCPESKKPVKERAWLVIQRNGNASAFNGYAWQPSKYSAVHCPVCVTTWRTKAAFVSSLPDGHYSKESGTFCLSPTCSNCKHRRERTTSDKVSELAYRYASFGAPRTTWPCVQRLCAAVATTTNQTTE